MGSWRHLEYGGREVKMILSELFGVCGTEYKVKGYCISDKL